MKAKNVKNVLNAKFASFVKSIKDSKVREIVEGNTIITGGAIASMLLGEDVNDYDLYFRTQDVAEVVANYYCDLYRGKPPKRHKGNVPDIKVISEDGRVKIFIKSSGVVGENPQDISTPTKKDGGKYRPVFISSNAITLTDRVQLVIRFHGEPDKIHENYDFEHCTNYWSSWNNNLVLRPGAIEALLARELRYVGSKYPLCSIIRTRKFIERKWTITAGQYLKMAMQLNELDLGDIDVLEDQLCGVDTSYFELIIAALRKRNNDKVDANYLTELINKLF